MDIQITIQNSVKIIQLGNFSTFAWTSNGINHEVAWDSRALHRLYAQVTKTTDRDDISEDLVIFVEKAVEGELKV